MSKHVVYIYTNDGFIDVVIDGKTTAFYHIHTQRDVWMKYLAISPIVSKGVVLDEKYLKLRGIPLYEEDK